MINYFWVSIKGKNTKRIINNILNEKINILNIKYLKNEILIKISYEDYKKLKDVRTSYKVNIIKKSGSKKFKENLLKYKVPILSFILNMVLLIILSNHIFYINIDTNNKELKKEIEKELVKNDITLFSKKKDFKSLEKIKNKIKNDNQNTIEWIEFNTRGVSFEVKVIERIKKYNNLEKDEATDIIAKRNGYIRKIYSTSGDVLKNTDDYVEKGETIISGNIIKDDEIIAKTKSKGLVYAEVWYINKLRKEKSYKQLEPTDKSRFKLVLTIKNKSFNFINIPVKKSKNKNIKLFSNNLFALEIKKERVYKEITKNYTESELVKILEEKALKQMENKLSKDEYIIEKKTLKKYRENDRITIEILFKVYEEIGRTIKSPDIQIKKEE